MSREVISSLNIQLKGKTTVKHATKDIPRKA